MTKIVWKFSFCSLHFQLWFKFLEKVVIWLKNVTFIIKLPINKVVSFLKSNFWPKSKMQNSAYIKPLNRNFSAKCQKIGVGRGLGRVRTKNLLAQTIPGKIFGAKWSNPVKLEGKRKVWYLFLRVFLTAIGRV